MRHYPLSRYIKKALHIGLEFLEGYKLFHNKGPFVSVFGSARFTKSHRYYELGKSVGAALAQAGFKVLTGGGPGAMEATNWGAHSVKDASWGCHILLPSEQRPNAYLHQFKNFRNFCVRKSMLFEFSCAYVFLPGGFGTLDELLEVVTLIQTNKLDNAPMILVGKEFWQPMLDWYRSQLLKEGTINEAELERLLLVDSVDELMKKLPNSKNISVSKP